MARKSRPSRSLTLSLSSAFFLFGLSLLLIVNSINLYNNFQLETASIYAKQQRIAESAKYRVLVYLSEKFQALDTTSRIANLYESEALEKTKILNRLLGQEKAFRNLCIVNENNEQISHASRLSSMHSFSISDSLSKEINAAFERKNQFISSIYIDSQTSEPLVIMAVPIKNPLGNYDTILIAETKLRFMWDVMKDIQVGEAGRAYVVDNIGTLIAYADITRALKRENISHIDVVQRFMHPAASPPTSTFSSQSEGIEGTTVISSFATLESPKWAVVTELPVREAYANIISQVKFSLFTLLIALSFAVFIGYAVSNRIAKPIVQLRNMIKRIRSKELNTKLILPEAPHREIQDLGNSFKEMVHELNETTVSKDALLVEVKEREKTEEALRKAKITAEEASKSKSAFLANMSHEIRTPLNGIIGFSSLMFDTQLDDEQQDFLSTIQTSGEALLSIINDILDFSKIEAGKLDFESNPFPINQCVEEALDIVSHKAHAKELELTYFIHPSVPEVVLGDITRLRQIIINLLNNAIKFTAHGEVSILVHCDPVQDNNQQRIYFSVKDTGIGIPPDKLELIFQSFSQVDASTTRRFGGTGLGLAICKRLCEAMGGSITVDSIEGEGSTFTFDILIHPAPEHITNDTDSHLLSGHRVLIVDDNETNLKLLEVLCTKWKMPYTLARSAHEALELPHDFHSYDLALLDYMMPDIDGYQLAAMLQARGYNGATIILSSHGSQLEVDPSIVDRWLLKPVKRRSLLDAMVKCMRGKGIRLSSHELRGSMDKEHPMRIAVAERNTFNRKIIVRFLKELGYDADAFGSAADLIDHLASTQYDLILIDLYLTTMDGFTTSSHILAMMDPAPRIIGMSLDDNQSIRAACQEAGMVGFLHKPFQIEELTAALIDVSADVVT